MSAIKQIKEKNLEKSQDFERLSGFQKIQQLTYFNTDFPHTAVSEAT